jgi:Zn-dependent protease with chaperone function
MKKSRASLAGCTLVARRRRSFAVYAAQDDRPMWESLRDHSRGQIVPTNAYVTGIGPTARIVMWDTLLAEMNHDEVLAVMGHEMGHYVLRHIWKGLAFSVALSFFVFFAAQKLSERGWSRWGARWRLSSLGDPAAVPWLLLVFLGLGFLLTPVGAAYSRHNEHESDIFSLDLTHLNEPMATAFVKLAENSKRDPNPHPLIEYWRYSHPPIAKRIKFALEYKRGNDTREE